MNTYLWPPNLLFGIDESFLTMPIVNLPANTVGVRRRIRNNYFPVAFVKTSDGRLSGYILERDPKGLRLELNPSQGVNQIDATEKEP